MGYMDFFLIKIKKLTNHSASMQTKFFVQYVMIQQFSLDDIYTTIFKLTNKAREIEL